VLSPTLNAHLAMAIFRKKKSDRSKNESLQEDVYNIEYVSKAIQSLARKKWFTCFL
jgi:hypothetical protein